MILVIFRVKLLNDFGNGNLIVFILFIYKLKIVNFLFIDYKGSIFMFIN